MIAACVSLRRAARIHHLHPVAARALRSPGTHSALARKKRGSPVRNDFSSLSGRAALCLRLRRRARSTLNATSLSSRIVRSGCKTAAQNLVEREHRLRAQLASSALIGLGRIRKAIAQHHASFRQRGQNHLVNMLGARREHQRHLRHRRESRGCRMQQHFANSLARSRCLRVRASP